MLRELSPFFCQIEIEKKTDFCAVAIFVHNPSVLNAYSFATKKKQKQQILFTEYYIVMEGMLLRKKKKGRCQRISISNKINIYAFAERLEEV